MNNRAAIEIILQILPVHYILLYSMNQNDYQNINAKAVDSWVESGWKWGEPINHETFLKAQKGEWSVLLTPTKAVPKEWFCSFKNARILGLASGGGQQIPVFTALGADCTILDYSDKQLESERLVAEREHYTVKIVKHDMTKRLPFEDNQFDLIFHPVSNCYIEDVQPVWDECYRILKPNGILLAGFDNGINYLFNDDETEIVQKLPFNPLEDEQLYKKSVEQDWGIQFSHTIEEQIGGQLKAGFTLSDIYQDINEDGNLHTYNVPTFYATKAVKKA
jgi:SAM-dependent methyltransferase